MAAVPLMLMAASTAVSAIGSIRQGQAAQQAADANARSMEANAAIARSNAAAQDEQMRRQARAQQGRALAASAEAGAGLNADMLRQSIYDAEMDSATIRYEGNLRAAGLQDQANMQRWEGKQKKTAGYLNAAGTLLNAGASYYGAMSKPDYSAFADRAGAIGTGSGGRMRTITGGR
jgi:hypothetical protein